MEDFFENFTTLSEILEWSTQLQKKQITQTTSLFRTHDVTINASYNSATRSDKAKAFHDNSLNDDFLPSENNPNSLLYETKTQNKDSFDTGPLVQILNDDGTTNTANSRAKMKLNSHEAGTNEVHKLYSKSINEDLAENCVDIQTPFQKIEALNNLIIWAVQAPLKHLEILPKPIQTDSSAILLLIQTENPEKYIAYEASVKYWNSITCPEAVSLSNIKVLSRLKAFSDDIILKILLDNVYESLSQVGQSLLTDLESAISSYLLFGKDLCFNTSEDANLWKSNLFSSINTVIGYQKVNLNSDIFLTSRASSLKSSKSLQNASFKLKDVSYLSEQAMKAKVFSISVGITKLLITQFNQQSEPDTKLIVTNSGVQEFFAFLRSLCSLPDKFTQLFYYKLIPDILTREKFFQSIISDIYDTLKISNKYKLKAIDSAILEFMSKICRIGYADYLAKSLYDYSKFATSINHEDTQPADDTLIFSKWVAFIEKLMSSYKNRIKKIFFKFLFEDLSDEHVMLLNLLETTTSNENSTTSKITERLHTNICLAGKIIEIWARQISEINVFYEFVISLVKVNATCSSRIYSKVASVSLLQTHGNYLCIPGLQSIFSGSATYNASFMNGKFQDINLLQAIASEWSSKSLVSQEIPEVLQSLSAAFLLCINISSDKHFKSVFNDSKFMSAVPIYFDLTNTCVRLAATVVAETITKRYTDLSGVIGSDSPEDIDLDFGLDSIILLGDEAESTGHLSGNVIGESILIKQLRILSKIDLKVNILESSNLLDLEILWYFDFTRKMYLSINSIHGNNLVLPTEKSLGKLSGEGGSNIDVVYAKMSDSFLSDPIEANTAEFVKPRPRIFLRDCIKALRNQSSSDWEIKYDVMNSLPHVIVTTDSKELVNLAVVVCSTVMQSVYAGPDTSLDTSATRMSAAWDQSRKSALVCIGLRLPKIVIPYLVTLVLSRDFSAIDKSIILSSVSGISLTFYGTLPLPQQFDIFINNQFLSNTQKVSEKALPSSNQREFNDKKATSKANLENRLLSKMELLGLSESDGHVDNVPDSILGIREAKTTFRSRKLDLISENNQRKNSSRNHVMKVAGINQKGYLSFIGPDIYFPLISTLLPSNVYSDIIHHDNSYHSIWEMNSSLILERVFTTIGIVLHTAGNSPHIIKMISEYLKLVIQLQSLASINNLLDNARQESSLGSDLQIGQPSNSFNRNQVISLLDTLLLGMVSIVDDDSPLLSHRTLLTHFRAELISIFIWLKDLAQFGLITESPQVSSGFIAMVNVGNLLSNPDNLVYGSRYSSSVSMKKPSYKYNPNISIL